MKPAQITLLGREGKGEMREREAGKSPPQKNVTHVWVKGISYKWTFWVFLTESLNPLLHEPNSQGVSIEMLCTMCVCVSVYESLPEEQALVVMLKATCYMEVFG